MIQHVEGAIVYVNNITAPTGNTPSLTQVANITSKGLLFYRFSFGSLIHLRGHLPLPLVFMIQTEVLQTTES
jgi:hypothetical protein